MKKNKILLICLIIVSFPLYCGELLDENKTINNNIEKIIELTNKDRIEHGKEELRVNEKLALSAKTKAEDMKKNKYFEHDSPEGITPWHWIEKANYNYLYAGENLAINYLYVDNMQEAFMRSKGHKENILSEDFEEIGVAKVDEYIVIHFGSRELEE